MTIHVGRRAAVAVVVLIALTAGGIAYATIPSGGVLNACYQKNNGQLRLVDGTSCRPDENAVSWNQTGPPGANGTNGTDGAPGAPGISGFQIVRQFTPTDASAYKQLTVACPAGKTLIGGGTASWYYWTPDATHPTPALGSSFAIDNGHWYGEATATTPGTWYLEVDAHCAYVNP